MIRLLSCADSAPPYARRHRRGTLGHSIELLALQTKREELGLAPLRAFDPGDPPGSDEAAADEAVWALNDQVTLGPVEPGPDGFDDDDGDDDEGGNWLDEDWRDDDTVPEPTPLAPADPKARFEWPAPAPQEEPDMVMPAPGPESPHPGAGRSTSDPAFLAELATIAHAAHRSAAHVAACRCPQCALLLAQARVGAFMVSETLRAALTGDRSKLDAVLALVTGLAAERPGG
ncbi:MAG TPA: hypothetical protein VGE74_24215 [Gemmata sp.]